MKSIWESKKIKKWKKLNNKLMLNQYLSFLKKIQIINSSNNNSNKHNKSSRGMNINTSSRITIIIMHTNKTHHQRMLSLKLIQLGQLLFMNHLKIYGMMTLKLSLLLQLLLHRKMILYYLIYQVLTSIMNQSIIMLNNNNNLNLNLNNKKLLNYLV